MSYFVNAITQHYVDFGGRARRREYWMYTLLATLAAFAAMILDNILGTAFPPLTYGWIYLLFVLGTFLPALAVGFRRLHDVGKSGWFLLIVLIPLIGAIWLLVVLCRDGEPNDNRYGPNPKEDSSNSSEVGAGTTASRSAQQHGYSGHPVTRACPECGELILAVARKCKHCGSSVTPLVAAQEQG